MYGPAVKKYPKGTCKCTSNFLPLYASVDCFSRSRRSVRRARGVHEDCRGRRRWRAAAVAPPLEPRPAEREGDPGRHRGGRTSRRLFRTAGVSPASCSHTRAGETPAVRVSRTPLSIGPIDIGLCILQTIGRFGLCHRESAKPAPPSAAALTGQAAPVTLSPESEWRDLAPIGRGKSPFDMRSDRKGSFWSPIGRARLAPPGAWKLSDGSSERPSLRRLTVWAAQSPSQPGRETPKNQAFSLPRHRPSVLAVDHPRLHHEIHVLQHRDVGRRLAVHSAPLREGGPEQGVGRFR